MSKGGRNRLARADGASHPRESWGRTLAYAAAAGTAIVVVGIFVRVPPTWFTGPFQFVTSRLSYLLISRLTPIPVALAGTELRLANHTLRIDYLCTAVDLMIIYALVVWLMPVSRASRLRALAVGVPLIFITNLFRIVALAGVSQWMPMYFRAIHGYTFEAFMVFAVAGIWGVWLWTCRAEWR